MELSRIPKCFYLDKEKDIVVNLFENGDELTYILETPNHRTGNLITNLAKICNVEISKNDKDMKIIKGVIPLSINGDNEEVYIFRLGIMKVANIYKDGIIEIKAQISAITKTLMSQTKRYNLSIEKTIAKSYILKKTKFRTDLHTHMNANLSPDALIALGIKHQIRYPLYYIKKLDLKLTKEQEDKVYKKRMLIEKQFEDLELTGKYLIRRIDDNTFINFADLILNNIENADYNISKIRTSLAILKDGQAVFTNLEKLYIYRYVFCKGIQDDEKMVLSLDKINRIPEHDIKKMLEKMLEDNENLNYQNITLRQDKFLWIAREYEKQGINYVEIADTDLVVSNGRAIKLLEEVHKIMPIIEAETGVKIRFLAAIRRIPLTIIKSQKTSPTYLRDNLDMIRTVAKSPYVVGSDFIGEEINDISELKPVIKELVEYVTNVDQDFTIRIHAGENDSLRDNVAKSIECVRCFLKPNQKMPYVRIGHGLYTADLNSDEGKKLINEIRDNNVVLEFQLTSNVRLNNLNNLNKHPLKIYLQNGIKCVQGTDGCGFYGTDTIDEQLALQNLLGITEEEFLKMRTVEDEIIRHREIYFERKSKEFVEFLNGRSIVEAFTLLEEENHNKSKDNNIPLRITDNLESEAELKDNIKNLPENKVPIIIAGGSFNNNVRETVVTREGVELLENLVKKVDPQKAYFVIGHKVQGYEKAIIDICSKLKMDFEIYAIVPKALTKKEIEKLKHNNINGVRISTESEAMGIYKSFNYEIFERRSSVVVAFDGNWAVSNLVQEAKNGKGSAKIYVNEEIPALKDKVYYLEGYVVPFKVGENIVDRILEENSQIVCTNFKN